MMAVQLRVAGSLLLLAILPAWGNESQEAPHVYDFSKYQPRMFGMGGHAGELHGIAPQQLRPQRASSAAPAVAVADLAKRQDRPIRVKVKRKEVGKPRAPPPFPENELPHLMQKLIGGHMDGNLPRVADHPPKIKRVAVCMVGHVRTFVQEGVHSGFVTNVLDTLPAGARGDVFMVGHLGNDGHACKRDGHCDAPTVSDDPLLQKALAFPGLNVKHVELHNSGNCEELQEEWRKDGHNIGVNCSGRPGYLQTMWLDHCFRKVQQSKEKYDLILRTRPDVGFWQPVAWENISDTKINYMPHHHGGGIDWIFTMPPARLKDWWAPITESYQRTCTSTDSKVFQCPYPDRVFWPKEYDDPLTKQFMPLVEPFLFHATLIRGPGAAVCWELFGFFREKLAKECKQAVADQYFELPHKRSVSAHAPVAAETIQFAALRSHTKRPVLADKAAETIPFAALRGKMKRMLDEAARGVSY